MHFLGSAHLHQPSLPLKPLAARSRTKAAASARKAAAARGWPMGLQKHLAPPAASDACSGSFQRLATGCRSARGIRAQAAAPEQLHTHDHTTCFEPARASRLRKWGSCDDDSAAADARESAPPPYASRQDRWRATPSQHRGAPTR